MISRYRLLRLCKSELIDEMHAYRLILSYTDKPPFLDENS